MTLAFDHFVLLVRDLDAAQRDFEALGFTVQDRADTEHGKTRFKFVPFEDGSYILLTSYTSPEAQAAHRLGEVLDAGEGWADWSFAVADAEDVRARLDAANLPSKGPVRVSNVIADGAPWALDLLMCGRGANGDVCLPFVVSDVEGRAARIPSPKPHRNGATGLKSLTLSTESPEAVVKSLAALGGTEVAKGHFVFGEVSVTVAPIDTPQGRPGGGMVEAVLTGPVSRTFDIALSHGAPMRMEAS
ncbi:VOC family protein [Tropicimonas isoalkanivorans]|uniref:Glyoxalase-like domain-containing protein n=1 Tax=Tropicimonas isoalkanivorans TaxID=441112 RepID=A0A1I1KNV1_9RHOB|nr:VOC family protein [Tropicimonas isoalkanivorans]SFC62546.1 Glyoxalase-like domain-containing protein [Tropicimonas isoalkanivorans]